MSTAKANDKVKVHYTGSTDGVVFDTSKERDPLEFTVGSGQVIPGFDKALVGMAIDETKTIEIPCAEAYGERNENLKQEIPRDAIKGDMEPQVGMPLTAQKPDGGTVNVFIAEVKDDTIVVDGNHPLAGKDLKFEITLVEIV